MNVLLPYFEATCAYRDHHFAYHRGRGYKDALAYAVCTWLWEIGRGKRVVVHCSDVSGAFDRVQADRLVDKLKAKGINDAFVLVLSSWLGPRTAHVVVDGVLSEASDLRAMVFQGTVLGHPLW